MKLSTKMKLSEIFKDESCWTIGFFAKDSSNNPVAPTDPQACKFWLLGAARRISYDKDPADFEDSELVYSRFREFLQACVDEVALIQWTDVTSFNDEEADFEDIQKVAELVDSAWDYENWKPK